jgi:N-acetylmuramoyl-L-alanine amidase
MSRSTFRCAAAAAATALLLVPAAAASASDDEAVSSGVEETSERVLTIRLNLGELFPNLTEPEEPEPSEPQAQQQPAAEDAVPEPEPEPEPETHTVRAGESLSLIALQYGLDLDDLFAANGKSWDDTLIHPGQQIRLARPEKPARPETAATGGRHAAVRDLTAGNGVMELVAETAEDMGVDPALALAFAEQESGFRPEAVSSAGALGTMQVMPANEQWASDLAGRPLDLADAEDNITAGIAIIRHLIETSPDLDTAIASYYQGAYGVAAYGMYQETVVYVASVKERLAKFTG